jgi:hypothetical protein
VTSLLARNVGILLATLAYLGLAVLARGGLAALFSHPALIALTIETRVLDWLRGMIGLPADFRGVVQDSASIATLAALLAARKKALGGLGNRDGLAARCFSPVGWRAADVRKPRHHTGAIRLGSNNRGRVAIPHSSGRIVYVERHQWRPAPRLRGRATRFGCRFSRITARSAPGLGPIVSG